SLRPVSCMLIHRANSTSNVMPTQAAIHKQPRQRDSGLRRNDEVSLSTHRATSAEEHDMTATPEPAIENHAARELTPVPGPRDALSAILIGPPEPRALYVYGHGAGAGMRHAFMESTARKLASRGIATFRYNFPYMERGSRRPDWRPVLLRSVRAAVEDATV